MRVMVMVKATQDSEAGVMPSEKLLADMGNFNEQLVKAGLLLAGEGLHPSVKGKRVQFDGTRRTVVDGPFAETKELVAGFWIWKVKSMEEAIAWVKKCPNPMPGPSEIEILPEVVSAARQFFKLPDDPRVHVEIGEAHDYLAGSERRYDLLLVDAFDDRGRSGMVDSVPFYMNCRDRLRRHGVASFNFLARSRGAAPAIARIREAFGERVWVLPQTEAGNIVVLGGAAPPARNELDELREAAARLKEQTGLDLTGTLARI